MHWRCGFFRLVSFTLLVTFLSTSVTPAYALKPRSTAEKTVGLEDLAGELKRNEKPAPAFILEPLEEPPLSVPVDLKPAKDPAVAEQPGVVIPSPPPVGDSHGLNSAARLARVSQQGMEQTVETSAPLPSAGMASPSTAAANAASSVRPELVPSTNHGGSAEIGGGKAQTQTGSVSPMIQGIAGHPELGQRVNVQTPPLQPQVRELAAISPASLAEPPTPQRTRPTNEFRFDEQPANVLPPTGQEPSSRFAAGIPSIPEPVALLGSAANPLSGKFVQKQTAPAPVVRPATTFPTLAGAEESNREEAKEEIMRWEGYFPALEQWLRTNIAQLKREQPMPIHVTVETDQPNPPFQAYPLGEPLEEVADRILEFLGKLEGQIPRDLFYRVVEVKGVDRPFPVGDESAGAYIHRRLFEAGHFEIRMVPPSANSVGVEEITWLLGQQADQKAPGAFSDTVRPEDGTLEVRVPSAAAGLEQNLLLSRAELLELVNNLAQRQHRASGYVFGRFTYRDEKGISLRETSARSFRGILSPASITETVPDQPGNKFIVWLEPLRDGRYPLQIVSTSVGGNFSLDSEGLQVGSRRNLAEIFPDYALEYLPEWLIGENRIPVSFRGREFSFEQYEAIRKQLASTGKPLPLVLLLDKTGVVHVTPAHFLGDPSRIEGVFEIQVEPVAVAESPDAPGVVRSIRLKSSEAASNAVERALGFSEKRRPLQLFRLLETPFSVVTDEARVVLLSRDPGIALFSSAVAAAYEIPASAIGFVEDNGFRVRVETPREEIRLGDRLLVSLEIVHGAGVEEETAVQAAPRPAGPAVRSESATNPAAGRLVEERITQTTTATMPADLLHAPSEPLANVSSTQRTRPVLIMSPAVFSAALQLSSELYHQDGRPIPAAAVVESPDWIPAVYAQAEQARLNLTRVVSLTEFNGNVNAAIHALEDELAQQNYEPIVARRIADLKGVGKALGVARPETFRRVVEALLQEQLGRNP
ncbi:MAG: hypothetical protein HYZ88_03550 [Candidatus Omnitrophica bacterium]|nr:hypothetical protein [Candidatus Omnitrophota bacterium]